MPQQPLSELRNIGKTVAQRLMEIGIHTPADLADTGAARAYRQLSARHPGKHLPVCYYLYSLQGALDDRHWDDFSPAEKQALRRAAGVDE